MKKFTIFAAALAVAFATFTATNAGVYRVSFPGEYLPGNVKVGVGTIGAATTASAFILSN